MRIQCKRCQCWILLSEDPGVASATMCQEACDWNVTFTFDHYSYEHGVRRSVYRIKEEEDES